MGRRLRSLGLVGLLGLVGVLVVVSASSAAPPPWGSAIQVPGSAALGSEVGVFSVSCRTAGNCAAGGDYRDGSGHIQAFVVDQTNGTWGAAIEVPGTAALNAGGRASVISVSCAGAGNCAAGGFYLDGSGHRQGFVVDETGGSWGAAIEVPGTATLNIGTGVNGDNTGVSSVSCATAGNCAAGGKYIDGSGHTQGFVVDEMNGSWGTAIEVPGTATLNSGGVAEVDTVSCAAAGECAAGGAYLDGSNHLQSFVVDETNASWGTAIEVPGTATLNSGGDALVYSISCAAAGNCAAGGVYMDVAGHAAGQWKAFLVNETNGTWGSAIEVPGTAAFNSSGYASLNSISCATAGNCAAGGTYPDGAGHGQAFVVGETNGTWGTAIEVPGTAAFNSGQVSLPSISCATAGNCVAGGAYRDGAGHGQAFVVDETDGVWGTATDLPGAATLGSAGGSGVSAVSCATVGNCAAGGSYGDGAGHTQSFVANSGVGAVPPVEPPAISVSPAIGFVGPLAPGTQLSTTDGTWTNSPTGYVYRWQRCDNTGQNCTDIPNATSPQYTLVAVDGGYEIRSEVLASNDGGPAVAGYAPSAATDVVARRPVVVTLPKLSGIPKIGNALSVNHGSWEFSPTSYAYQWLRCTSMGASCKKIAGATSSTYLLAAADAGHKLKATVTASNAAGSATATSKPSAKITK